MRSDNWVSFQDIVLPYFTDEQTQHRRKLSELYAYLSVMLRARSVTSIQYCEGDGYEHNYMRQTQ